MTDPQQPKHNGNDPGVVPFTPPADNAPAPPDDPKAKQDLPYNVPTVTVGWTAAPSFNLDPPNSESGGNNNPVPPCPPFTVDLSSLRAAEGTMLDASRTAVSNYQTLRDKVLSEKDTVFGQTAIDNSQVTGIEYYQPAPGGDPSPLQDIAKQFAETMNPAQDKVLAQMAAALEVVGQYIAAVNRAGQSYGRADRKAEFPAPPANPVTS
jgi:hypothetical protein